MGRIVWDSLGLKTIHITHLALLLTLATFSKCVILYYDYHFLNGKVLPSTLGHSGVISITRVESMVSAHPASFSRLLTLGDSLLLLCGAEPSQKWACDLVWANAYPSQSLATAGGLGGIFSSANVTLVCSNHLYPNERVKGGPKMKSTQRKGILADGKLNILLRNS